MNRLTKNCLTASLASLGRGKTMYPSRTPQVGLHWVFIVVVKWEIRYTHG